MATYSALDYYDVDDLFTEEERMIRDTVREYVDREVLPIINKHNRAGTFPMELVPGMADLGLLGDDTGMHYGQDQHDGLL